VEAARDNARVRRREFLTGLGRVLAASAAVPLLDACGGGGGKSSASTTHVPPRLHPLTGTGRGLQGLDMTGATDVTAGMQAFIDSVSNGATIRFPAHARYRLDGTLNVVDRHGLTFVGQDTWFQHTRRGVRSTFHWGVLRGSDLTWRGLTLVGQNTDGGYTGALEAQHGWNIAGTNGFEIDNCVVRHIYGDFVYMTNYPANRVASNGHIHNCRFSTNGRQGISFIGANHIEVGPNNTFNHMARACFDFEVTGPGQPVDTINIHDNTFGIHRLNFISSGTNPMLAAATNITINNNTARSFCQIYFKGGSTSAIRAANFVFTNNIADGPAWGTGGNPACLAVQNIDGLTVTGNTQPLRVQSPTMYMVQAHACTGSTVSGNILTPASNTQQLKVI